MVKDVYPISNKNLKDNKFIATSDQTPLALFLIDQEFVNDALYYYRNHKGWI